MQLALCYKNFAANANISHIGLGVSALNTANQLSDFDKEHHHNVGDALLAGTTFGQYGKGLDKQREAIQSQIAAAEALASSKATEANAAQAQGTNTKAEESGALSATSIANQTKAATALATLHRTQAEIQIAAAHAVRQAEIDGILESQTRAVASSAEQVRVALETRDALQKIDFDETQAHIAQVNARAAAESRGKSAPEAARIQTTARGEVAGLTATQVQEETKLQGDYIKAEGAYVEAVATLERYLSEEVIKSGEKRMEAINKEVDAILAAAKNLRRSARSRRRVRAKPTTLQSRRTSWRSRGRMESNRSTRRRKTSNTRGNWRFLMSRPAPRRSQGCRPIWSSRSTITRTRTISRKPPPLNGRSTSSSSKARTSIRRRQRNASRTRRS